MTTAARRFAASAILRGGEPVTVIAISGAGVPTLAAVMPRIGFVVMSPRTRPGFSPDLAARTPLLVGDATARFGDICQLPRQRVAPEGHDRVEAVVGRVDEPTVAREACSSRSRPRRAAAGSHRFPGRRRRRRSRRRRPEASQSSRHCRESGVGADRHGVHLVQAAAKACTRQFPAAFTRKRKRRGATSPSARALAKVLVRLHVGGSPCRSCRWVARRLEPEGLRRISDSLLARSPSRRQVRRKLAREPPRHGSNLVLPQLPSEASGDFPEDPV
jgi:hypothetical protein